MKRVEFDKHKFDTRWRFAALVTLLFFAAFLQYIHSPMAGEFITLIIGLIGGGVVQRHTNV